MKRSTESTISKKASTKIDDDDEVDEWDSMNSKKTSTTTKNKLVGAKVGRGVEESICNDAKYSEYSRARRR